MAKTELEDQEEKKVLTRDEEDIGEGSVRGTMRVIGEAIFFCSAQYYVVDWTGIVFRLLCFLYVQVVRRKGNLGALSGADGSRYMEYDSKPPKKHPMFKPRYVKLYALGLAQDTVDHVVLMLSFKNQFDLYTGSCETWT